ncbi:MAG: betaine/proline/choline family ABC transporter ATP-binding protein [Acidimicrobiaceae bacterium]|nr:betaine/proline/choline family ABC transporter ATP-binding protein [Acidimicrobiaceae bacterium]
MTANAEDVIVLDGVYKIFGPQPNGRAYDLAVAGKGKDAVKTETGHVIGLDNVTLSVGRGEIFVVMGLSGSGKSTAIRTVNKLHDITAGRITVQGTDVQALRGDALQTFRRRHMGMVFQHFALYPHRNVIDNVSYGLKVQRFSRRKRREAGMRALDLVGLGAYAMSMPAELSGGMQQRVGLARALASDPDILLMDEAFSALDPLIRRQMQDELLQIHRELHKTILFITHDLNEALRIGDRVCIMKDGTVVQIDTPKDILLRPVDSYVAEFIRDVDQGRVIQIKDVMQPPISIGKDIALPDVLTRFDENDDSCGVFVVDSNGAPTHVVASSDCAGVSRTGNGQLDKVMHTDFNICHPLDHLNTVYACADRDVPIAVCDDSGKLVGNLDSRHILKAMGRVESLVGSFECEVLT